MAEIDMEEKNRISHRAKALRAIGIKLKEYSLKMKSSN
jgi:inosine/xanthosine triphosphate pyrophosphatase family protein